MPGKQLRDRVDHDIRAQIERLHGGGRGEGVVDGDEDTARLRHCDDRVQVGDPKRRVRHHLDQDHLRLGPDRRLEGRRVGRIGKRGRDAEARQILFHHPKRPPVKLVGAKRVVASLEQAEERRPHGRHAGAGDDAAVRPLHPVDQPRQHLGVRMALAGIGEPLRAAFVLRVQFVGVGAGIDHGRLDRRHDRTADRRRPARTQQAIGQSSDSVISRRPSRYCAIRFW